MKTHYLAVWLVASACSSRSVRSDTDAPPASGSDDLIDVEVRLRYGNRSTYDFVKTRFCSSDHAGADCVRGGPMERGFVETETSEIEDVPDGGLLLISVTAEDADGFIYYADEELRYAAFLDIDLVLTDADCCWE